MGLIKAALGAVGGTLADQWLEFFVCESLEADVLVAKGQKKDSKRSQNVKGESNVISNGSGVVVNKGQAAIIVDNGKIAEFCAEEGKYTYDQSSESSIFYGDLGKSAGGTIKNMWERFKFGGIPSKDQRIYYFNTKEILGNKYGTPAPIPYLIYDPNINLKLTISLRANGEYSYRIANPILFYTNVCGNVEPNYTRDKIDSQLKAEIITALGPALKELGGLEYHEISFHTEKLAEIFNEKLSAKWKEHRGIEVVSFGITCTASPEDEKRIKDLQASAVMRDPTMAAATLVNAQSDAMRDAAKNQAGMGAMGAFIGMGMAGQAGGMNAQSLFGMGGGQPQPVAGMPGLPAAAAAAPAPAAAGWTCACGHAGNTGKFCADCGKPMPPPATSWTCACGHVNTGKFCAECGAAMPAGPWTCACGHAGNTGKFCAECGKSKG
ncbi:MAG: SPFH domain-containing protein [Chitinispirillia bacterium]|nr:SPFH domain-containing protein [Chitinispirillia bacterium]MCL2242583.1 SPFH domain-containing protein [Chitinispirillia bacterium]